MKLSVAIDGPAGSGKSTIAKIISDEFNLMYINTGAMYRAVTLFSIEKNISEKDIDSLSKLIDSLSMEFDRERLIVNGKDITEDLMMPNISNNVSRYAAVPKVREKLVLLQQKMGKQYNVIMDGRDIGTVVLKDAPFKFFLTAKPEERAKRRYNELINKGVQVHYDTILQDIKKRDYLDSNRATSPLKKAEDAIEIDSSTLTINEVVEQITDYIKNKK